MRLALDRATLAAIAAICCSLCFAAARGGDGHSSACKCPNARLKVSFGHDFGPTAGRWSPEGPQTVTEVVDTLPR